MILIVVVLNDSVSGDRKDIDSPSNNFDIYIKM